MMEQVSALIREGTHEEERHFDLSDIAEKFHQPNLAVIVSVMAQR